MKKISILLAAMLLVAFLIGGTVAYADEVDNTDPPTDETEEPIEEEETVEVPKELWDEILEVLEQLKGAQSGDDVKDIVENTFGARIREYFGESWGDIILVAVFVVFSIIFAFVNKKKTSTLLAGVETVYKTTKTAVGKISKKVDGTTLDEIIELSAGKSATAATKAEASERMSRAALEMIKLLVLQSNAKETVKAQAEKLYQGAVEEDEV